MYKKCTRDKSGLEPKSLFHMVQFLMFCSKAPVKYTITVEDTLELLYVRFGREKLDDEIHAIFGYSIHEFRIAMMRKRKTAKKQK